MVAKTDIIITKMLNIFFIGQKGIPATYGGVEHHVEQLSTRLAERGHQVWVYCRRWYTGQNLKTYHGVNLLYLPSLNHKNLDAVTHTFLASLDVLSRKTDIIHYQGIGPSALLPIPKAGKPHTKIVATFHCKDYEHQKWGFFAQNFLKLGERIAVTRPHGTIVVSKVLQEYVAKKYKKEVIYIPNGVPILKPQKPKMIADWGLDKENYLLTVARLVAHKGIHYLIKAFRQIRTSLKLVIVGGPADGGGAYEKRLKELAEGDERVLFTGYQTGDTLAELFSNAYLFIHPSEAEGLPIAVLEALSYTRGVLASDIPEHLEAIGGAGFFFRNKNVKDLKEKLEKLIHEPLVIKEAGRKGRERVRKEYDWDKIVTKTDEFYDKLFYHHPKDIKVHDFAVHTWDEVTDQTESLYHSLL